MEQYIDKSALIAEIERRIEEEVSYDENGGFASWADENHYSTLETIKNFIDTLEVKEVDLDKELDSLIIPELKKYKALPSLTDVAKHFFELGLKVNKSLTWEDIANINEIVNEILKECGENILYNTQKDFCKEVLKRFKEQKGEI